MNDLLKQAKAGRPIKDEDIPPAVSLGKADVQPAQEAVPVPPPRSTSIPTSEDVSPTPPTPKREAPPTPPKREAPPTPPKRERPPTPPEPKEPPPPLPASENVDPAKAAGLQFILSNYILIYTLYKRNIFFLRFDAM